MVQGGLAPATTYGFDSQCCNVHSHKKKCFYVAYLNCQIIDDVVILYYRYSVRPSQHVLAPSTCTGVEGFDTKCLSEVLGCLFFYRASRN
jgi:hypothetical protein